MPAVAEASQGPDGLLYVLTEEAEAALLRIESAG
jgi:glucose/arabinose dehydrogenase